MLMDYLEAANPVSGKYVPIGNSGRVHVNPDLLQLLTMLADVLRLGRIVHAENECCSLVPHFPCYSSSVKKKSCYNYVSL